MAPIKNGNYIFYQLDEMCLSANGNPIKPVQSGLCFANDDYVYGVMYGMYPISGWSDWGNPVTQPVSNSVISNLLFNIKFIGSVSYRYRIKSCPPKDNYMYGVMYPISGWSSRGKPVTQPVSQDCFTRE